MDEHADDSISLRRRLSLELRRALRAVRGELWKPLAALLAAVIVQPAAALAPGLVEKFYARSVYPPVARTLSQLTGGLAFSPSEALFVLFSLLLLSVFALFVDRPARRRGEWRALVPKPCKLVLGRAFALPFVFMLVFGLTSQRPPLVETLGYDQRRANADELDAMTQ